MMNRSQNHNLRPINEELIELHQLPNDFLSGADQFHTAHGSSSRSSSSDAEAILSAHGRRGSTFRTHFVAYYDGESRNISDTALASGAQQDLVSEDHSDHGSPLPDDRSEQHNGNDNQTHPQDNVDFAQDKSSQLADDASEDIWAGEDAVMLRKSKTTFSVKSSKTDSESVSHSISHSMSQEPDTSSGADPFHTAHGSSSRPSSSDVEAMLSAHSGRGSTMTTTTEYETANSHADLSAHYSSYHTAASTLRSNSFCDHSGASAEHSEGSDTSIDVSIEHDRDARTPCGAHSEHELAFDD